MFEQVEGYFTADTLALCLVASFLSVGMACMRRCYE